MLTIPFLTEIDPRREVKGSRDPLGAQSIWTAFGRQIIGNLTTVSVSVRDFTIALLGYRFIEMAEESGYKGSALDFFLRWEQLAAYARAHVNREKGFRGTDRVHRGLAERAPVTISAEPQHQILGTQKLYGIWGLYSSPARASGLVEQDRPRLTEVAREHGDLVWTLLLDRARLRGGEALVEWLREPRRKLDYEGRDRELVAGVASLIRPRLGAAEQEFYRSHLVEGGPLDPTRGLQAQLAKLIEGRDALLRESLSHSMVAALAKEARSAHGKDSELAGHLERIRALEPLLALTSTLFAWLLSKDGQEIARVAKELRRHWGASLRHIDVPSIRELEEPTAIALEHDTTTAARWCRIAESLSSGLYSDTVTLLLEQNAHVMRVRDKSAPWLEQDRDGRLKVRFHDERAYLPERDELPRLWRYPYFIDSLRQVIRTVGAKA